MIVREELPEDLAGIRRVNEQAFGQSLEADIVDAVRAGGHVTLSLVAVEAAEIVGHILFSPVAIRVAEHACAAVGLGPMAVRPDHQRCGIGSALVRAGIERLRRAGHAAVVVLGHPAYYPRFGFRRASEFGIRWQYDAPDEAFMVLELAPASLAGCSGIVYYRPEFG